MAMCSCSNLEKENKDALAQTSGKVPQNLSHASRIAMKSVFASSVILYRIESWPVFDSEGTFSTIFAARSALRCFSIVDLCLSSFLAISPGLETPFCIHSSICSRDLSAKAFNTLSVCSTLFISNVTANHHVAIGQISLLTRTKSF